MLKPLQCLYCRAPLQAHHFNAMEPQPCGSCGKAVVCHVYGAIDEALEPSQIGEDLQGEEEAACYYHDTKQAAVPCDRCGRFLCKLCDIEFSNEHLCPQCLERLVYREAPEQFKPTGINWDKVGLFTMLASVVTVFPTLFTAPLVMFVVIYSRMSGQVPAGPRRPWAGIIAVILAALSILGWIIFGGVMIYEILQAINSGNGLEGF